MRRIIFTLSIIASFLPAGGQEIAVSARFDTTRMLIGDQINLWLQVEHPKTLNVEFPHTGDTLPGKLEVLAVSSPDTFGRTESSWKIRQRILVTSFDTGAFIVPPFKFLYHDGRDSLMTNSTMLEIIGMPVDTTKGITDIKPPYEVKLTFREIAPYLFALLLIAVLAFIYFRYLRKRSALTTIQEKPAPPPIPAHILALEKLDELVSEKLWQQGKTKLYFSRLTDILRQYIELRFKVPAMEETTDDILRDFGRNKLINEEIRAELKQLLELADLVKFAKLHPLAEENEASQQSAYDFILRTKQVVNLRKPSAESVEESQTEVE